MYESCTAQLNEWKPDAKVRMKKRGKDAKKGRRDDDNLVPGLEPHDQMGDGTKHLRQD
jgi:hypothetical protein